MPNGLTPTSGNFYMFQNVTTPVADTSLEYAVRMCIASGIRPSRIQNFASLLGSVVPSMVNNTYGTKGVVPDNQGALRGYPKPTLTMNYEVVTVTSSPDYQYLRCKPELNAFVGYNITVSIDIFETPYGDGIPATPQNTETFTFLAGSTSPDSSTLTPDGGGYYQLNQDYIQPTYADDILIATSVGTDNPTYFTEAPIQNFFLDYGGINVYTYTLYAYNQSTCGGTLGAQEVCYSDDSTISIGTILYQDAALTTPILHSYHALPYEELGLDYYILTCSSGEVTNISSLCTG